MGTMLLAAGSAPAKSGSFTPILIVVVIGVAVYFLLMRPQQRRRKQMMQVSNELRPGQRVRTTAGMYATVVDADNTDVVLEVAPGVHLRFLRRAIMDVLPDEDGTVAADPVTPEHAEPAAADDVSGDGLSADGQASAAQQNGAAPDSPADSSPADSTASSERKAD